MEETEVLSEVSALENNSLEQTAYEASEPVSEESEGTVFDERTELAELVSLFPGADGKNLSELVNEKRYEELRALGLSTEEAFFATAKKQARTHDNRSHLGTSVPRSVKAPLGAMSARELQEARELFGGVSDEELRSLYQRVTKQK